MKNCLIAQSGGPTAVINSSVIGVVIENKNLCHFDNVYGGLNGIEGILENKLINFSEMTDEEINTFRYTPSSGLGSCRYKMKNFNENEAEYKRFFEILNKYDIDTFFYVGGNDSMDTVSKLSEYAKLHSIDKRILGIPKTIDNDLMFTDHTPGYGSAAKFIATTVLETYLDSSVYMNNGVFILETMGRDTGWLAASAALAKINGKPVPDFIYLPEKSFSIINFLKDVRRKMQEQNKVYIVASEGLKNEEGTFLAQLNSESKFDNFGHAQLGGVCDYLKNLIVNAGITKRVKTLELGVMQRCAMHIASQVDLDEAFAAGKAALEYAIQGKTGYMVGIRRLQNTSYKTENFLIPANEVCNKIKYFPLEWISEKGNNINDAAIEYMNPLINESPTLNYENGLPKYTQIK
jgi:6-phosphofructokinase 1